jgi:uncharacterized protein YkwD
MQRVIHPVLVAVTLAAAAACAARAGDADKLKLTPEEAKILKLTNAARKEKKLKPLRLDPVLTEVARKHSANMASQGKLEHILDGKGAEQRIRDAGYPLLGWAENIFYNRDAPGAAAQGFKWWMDSREHRANILERKFQEIGIGIARNGKGQIYFTQVFSTRAKSAEPQ